MSRWLRSIGPLLLVFTAMLFVGQVFGYGVSTTDWNTASPAGSDAVSTLDDKIRVDKATLQTQLGLEHYFASVDDRSSHRLGSARCFVGTGAARAALTPHTDEEITSATCVGNISSDAEPAAASCTKALSQHGRCWCDSDGDNACYWADGSGGAWRTLSVTSLADNSVTNAKMADNAIGSVEIIDDSVATADLDGVATATESASTGSAVTQAAEITCTVPTITTAGVNVCTTGSITLPSNVVAVLVSASIAIVHTGAVNSSMHCVLNGAAQLAEDGTGRDNINANAVLAAAMSSVDVIPNATASRTYTLHCTAGSNDITAGDTMNAAHLSYAILKR